jgi:hypothetical protein
MKRSLPLAIMALAMAGCAVSKTSIAFGAPRTLSASTVVGTAPMLAVSPNGAIATAWVSAPNGSTDGRLYLQVDSGKITEIRDTLGPVEPHGEAPPKLAWSDDHTLDATYVVAKDDPTMRFPRTALRFIQSKDGGATWSAPITVTSDAAFGAHSFHAMHVGGDGTIYVAWLGGDPGKSASWITHSSDAGATWSPRVRVDTGNACPCCRTSLATDRKGALYLAWRHIYPGNIRDIVVAKSTDHGETWSNPVRVHDDNWQIDACPHAGPSMLVDSAGTVHIAWWTGKEKAAGVWYARSTDGAATFTTPTPLGVAQYSRPAHVQLALGPKQEVAAAWDDGTTKASRIVVRLSRNGGRSFGGEETVSADSSNPGFPVAAFSGDSLTVAWSNQPKGVVAAPMDMKNPKVHKGLESVGAASVVLREGRVE